MPDKGKEPARSLVCCEARIACRILVWDTVFESIPPPDEEEEGVSEVAVDRKH